MSDHNVAKSYQEGNGTSMRPYQSVWLAHWTRPGCKSANGACNNLSTSGESVEESSHTKKRPLLDGPIPVTSTAKHDIGSGGEVAGLSADNLNDESLTGRSKKRRKERLDSEPFSMLNVSQHRGGKLALNIEQSTASQGGALNFYTGSSSGHRTLSLDGKKGQSPSLLAAVPERGKPKKEQMKSKDIRVHQHQHENSNKFLNNNAPAVSPFVGDKTMGSASNFIPYGMSNRIPFTTYEQNINNEPNSCLSSKKQVGNTNFHTYSTVFVQETKINQLLDSTQATNALSRHHMRSFLLHNPSSSNLEQPNPYPIQCDPRKSSSNTLPFQSPSNHADTTLPEYLYHGGYSMQRLPFSVHDVETMRICTTVDSVGQELRGPPKFCQTSRRLMITEKTDVDLFEAQEFRGAVASTDLKEKTACALLSSSTDFRRHDQKENELIQPSSSTVNEENEKFENLSNESSSETDIMDMDAYQDNHLRGVGTSQADKELRSSKSPLLSANATGSVRKQIGDQIGDRMPKKRLLDINERPPNRSRSASLMDNGESSTSKTQTMDVEHLLSDAEQPRFSNSTVPPDDSSKREIDCGWVKRLRPCASESVHDTKGRKKEEDSSCAKTNQLNKMKCSSTSSDRSRGPIHGQEQGQTTTIVKVKDSGLCSNNLRSKNREMILSDPWIRRLCHDRPAPCEKNLETAVVHKSHCSKPILQQPFPSVAAMALMGKTVSGFQPCEFSRRGSSLVWNTEGI